MRCHGVSVPPQSKMTVLTVTPRYYERAPTRAAVRSLGEGPAGAGALVVDDMPAAAFPGRVGAKTARGRPGMRQTCRQRPFLLRPGSSRRPEFGPSLGLACPRGGLDRTRRQAH